MRALGTLVIFHSALVFISSLGVTSSIWTASVICRSIASFLNVPVMFIWNSCISPRWTSLQCRHSGEFMAFLALRYVLCCRPLVNAFSAVSPLYTFLSPHSPRHLISYVMPTDLQFPFPPDEHTKHSSWPHCLALKGFDVCSFLLSLPSAFLTTFF